MNKDNKLICDVCNKNEALGVACIPYVPISVAFCQECLNANSYPLSILIANTACCNGIENCNEDWKNMIYDSLRHQNKTIEWFNEEVAKSIKEFPIEDSIVTE